MIPTHRLHRCLPSFRSALFLCGAITLMLCSGCVKRQLVITSEPMGALVYLNDEEVGRTPVEVPFAYYGIYDVRLEQRGYEPLTTTGDTRGPLWEYPGPDLIAEAIPNAENTVRWHYGLVPATTNDQALAERETQRLKQAATDLRDLVTSSDTTENE